MISSLKVLVTLLLFLFLYSQLNFQESILYLKKASLAWLILALLLEGFGYLVDVLKQSLFLSTKGLKVTVTTLLAIRFIGGFFNNFLPSNIGGDVVRAVKLSTLLGNSKDSWASIIISRFLGVLVIFPMVSVSLLFYPFPKSAIPVNAAYPISLFLCFLTGYYLLFFNEAVTSKMESILNNLSNRFVRRVAKLYEAICFFKKDYGIIFLGSVYSLVYQILGIIAIYIVSVSLEMNISLKIFFVFIPIVALVSMLPISINGLGVQDVTFVYLFQMAGYDKEAGLAISIIWHMVRISATLPGGILFVLFKEKRE